jgi:lantibiotic biosynthesis protein
VRVAVAAANAHFRTRARAFALEVGDRLLRERAGVDGSRGLNGLAGFTLLYAALSDLTGSQRFTAAVHGSLRETARADGRPQIGLFGGISGLRAAAALAMRNEPRYSKLVAQCDAYVEAQLPQHAARAETYATYDLIAGWSGARLARGVSGPVATDRLVEFIVWTLDDRNRWRCRHPLRPTDAPVNDLGVAHGVGGMLAALSLTLDIFDEATAAVAARALRELCDARVWDADRVVWPPAVPGSHEGSFRSAWCYGSAGVLAVIHATAQALHDRETGAFAQEAMRRLATQPPESWWLDGEALCHGLVGNALCFGCVASATDSTDLWSIALDLADAAMDRLDANGGKSWAADFPEGRYDAVGLLDGVCGIALALLTLGGDADSSWMRLFGLRPLS